MEGNANNAASTKASSENTNTASTNASINSVNDDQVRAKSNLEKPTPLTPKPDIPKKLNLTQLVEIVSAQDKVIRNLVTSAEEKDVLFRKMEARLHQMEMEHMKIQSLLVVKDRVSMLLSNRITQLEQYTRRYSVIIKGIEKGEKKESHDTLKNEVQKLIDNCDSPTSFQDVDKFHRNGPRSGKDQDIIIRFKSHTAKEQFYKKRKTINTKGIKVQPSLCGERKKLLAEASDLMKDYPVDSLSNPPEFAHANVHGNLLVKFRDETDDGLFIRFDSLEELREAIQRHNSASSDIMAAFDDQFK